jgi:uncharacterized membrane protein
MIFPTSMKNSIPVYFPWNQRLLCRPGHLLLALLAIAAVIRFYGLEYSSLWLDELFSMIGASPSASFSDVYQYSVNDQPPFFFFSLHLWLKVFGYSDFAGRSLTCVYGVLGVFAIYFLGKELKDERLGLLLAFITSINWFHVDVSKEIRFYPLVFLLSTLSFFFFLRSAKHSRSLDFFCYFLFTSLLLNTHYYGMVVFVTQFLIFLWIVIAFNHDLKFLVFSLLTGIGAGLSLWHWLDVIFNDLKIRTFHVKAVSWTFPFDFMWSYIKDPVAFVIYITLIFFSLKKFFTILKKKRLQIKHAVMIGWLLFGICLPLGYSFLVIPLLTAKYATIVVPALFVLIANGFDCIKSEKIKTYMISAICISGLIVLFIARPPYKPRRAEDWREVAVFFSKRDANNELVVAQLSYFHQYYFGKFGLPPVHNQFTENFSDIMNSTPKVWLLVNSRYDGGYPYNGFTPDQKALINEKFSLTDSVKFKITSAFLYTRK